VGDKRRLVVYTQNSIGIKRWSLRYRLPLQATGERKKMCAPILKRHQLQAWMNYCYY